MSASETASSSGIGIGAAVAVAISYAKWHSVFWAIVHGILGWAYIIYHLITR